MYQLGVAWLVRHQITRWTRHFIFHRTNQIIMEAQKVNVIPLPRDMSPVSDEIDLRELVIALWHGKWWIFSTTFIATCLTVAFALWSPNIYRAEALLTPPLSSRVAGSLDWPPASAGWQAWLASILATKAVIKPR